MKVSLITLHRITNFGSLLQTYATQYYIESLGHEVEVIDFVPDGITFKRAVFPKHNGSTVKKLIKALPLALVNGIQFSMTNRFLKKHIHVTKKRYKSYAQLEKAKISADVFISGSDQVWNTQNNNPEDDLRAYYLCFAPENKRKIAYAGSFGKTVFSEAEKEKIKGWLDRYQAISVREDTALNTLEELKIFNGVHVVDPTMLLEKEDWIKFCGKKKPRQDYVFVYNLNRNKQLEEFAKALAEQKKLKLINFADTFEFIKGAKNRLFNSPYDFINYIANATYVVTDSFHGTAFSLNFEKQVVSFAAPKYNSRLESILRETNLIDKRFVNSVDEAFKAIDEPIDYAIISPILREHKEKSKNFLRKYLCEDE